MRYPEFPDSRETPSRCGVVRRLVVIQSPRAAPRRVRCARFVSSASVYAGVNNSLPNPKPSAPDTSHSAMSCEPMPPTGKMRTCFGNTDLSALQMPRPVGRRGKQLELGGAGAERVERLGGGSDTRHHAHAEIERATNDGGIAVGRDDEPAARAVHPIDFGRGEHGTGTDQAVAPCASASSSMVSNGSGELSGTSMHAEPGVDQRRADLGRAFGREPAQDGDHFHVPAGIHARCRSCSRKT